MKGAIDAWAQPANGRARQLLPEVARLFEKSGSAHLLDQPLSIEQTVERTVVHGRFSFRCSRPGRCGAVRQSHVQGLPRAHRLHRVGRMVQELGER